MSDPPHDEFIGRSEVHSFQMVLHNLFLVVVTLIKHKIKILA